MIPSRLNTTDKEFFAREIESFLPDRIFDAHTHLWRSDLAPWRVKHAPDSITYAVFKDLISDLYPNREINALFIPSVQPDSKGSFEYANAWIGEAIKCSQNNRGLFFVRPKDDPEWVRKEVRRLGLHGLKCYHTSSQVNPTWEAEIPDYLPEEFVKVAHQEKWVITLHLVRSRAVADPSNIHWIRHYCNQYPDMRLILAHSARGFQPAHNIEGLNAVTNLPNLFFDSSANCEPIAHQAILRICGHKKLMYGSDFPVSHSRGRSVSVADSFLWLYEETPVWGEKHLSIESTLVGLEHLRSLKWACWAERLKDKQVEDIFFGNALRVFNS